MTKIIQWGNKAQWHPAMLLDTRRVWKSKKASSRRTVAASNLIKSVVDGCGRFATNKMQQRRQSKKEKGKLNQLVEIKPSLSNSVPLEDCSGLTFGPDPTLEKRDDLLSGGVLWANKEEQIFAALLIKREFTLGNLSPASTNNTVEKLMQLQVTEKTCNRASKNTGSSSTGARYAIHGNKINRGGHGFTTDKLSKTQRMSAAVLDKFAHRLEHIAGAYVPSQWLRGLVVASDSGAWPTMGKCKLTAAMASTINYSAPAHIDDDFLFSIQQLNIGNRPYELHDPVCQYFCFPQYGVAIGLRPGDVLLFNPHVYHCLSEKTAAYSDVDVHATSLYTKTAHAGKNNNTIELTDEQTKYYEMSFPA